MPARYDFQQGTKHANVVTTIASDTHQSSMSEQPLSSTELEEGEKNQKRGET